MQTPLYETPTVNLFLKPTRFLGPPLPTKDPAEYYLALAQSFTFPQPLSRPTFIGRSLGGPCGLPFALQTLYVTALGMTPNLDIYRGPSIPNPADAKHGDKHKAPRTTIPTPKYISL